MSATKERPQSGVMVSPLCARHLAELLKRCGHGPQDPWQSLIVAAQVAMFQGVTADDEIREKLEGMVERIGELGCLACCRPALFSQLIDRANGAAHKSLYIGAIRALGLEWVEGAATGPTH